MEAPAKGEERFGNVEGLPSWLRLAAELRGRAEFNVDSEQDLDDRVYLNRLRLNAAVQPTRWVRFFFEGQDARAFPLNPGPAPKGQRHVFDVRQGYVELGNSEQGFQARVGRQELSLGDERLVGADNYWDPFGRAFDAARLSFAGERFRVEAFTGFLVEPADRRPDRWDRTSRLSGISAQFKTGAGGGLIEPYLLWKRARPVRLAQHPIPGRRRIPGAPSRRNQLTHRQPGFLLGRL